MRILLAAALCALSAACTRASEGEAAASVPAALTGEFRAASDSARNLTGNLSLERGGLIFDKGVVLYTRALMARQASERIARDGDSYAAILVSPADLAIDLRRVTEQTLTGAAASLCGEDAPAYVAIASEEHATSIRVLVFAGAEPPGPIATRSRLCGAFAYETPDGARTRQGVVLWR
jgi:hypothetical protein